MTSGYVPEMATRTERRTVKRPSEVSHDRTAFDEIAARVFDFASRGRFLVVVVAALIGWVVFGLFTGFKPEWIESGAAAMAGITLVLVFVVENANRRSDQAIQRKLNALAEAVAALLDDSPQGEREAEELRHAVGLEHRESVD